MKNKWTFIIATIVISLICLFIWMSGENQIISNIKIMEKAKELSGLSFSGVWETPIMISGDHLKIPFVGKSLKGKKVWQITVTNGSLGLESKNTGKDHEEKVYDFKIFLDYTGKKVLMITAVLKNGKNIQSFPKPSIFSAEKQMKDCGDEIYTGFPKKAPIVNFHDALKSVYNGFGGNPLGAPEIEAIYVMRSVFGKEPKAVWEITLRGIPPFPTFGGNGDSVPVSQRNHLRSTVDAKTGKLLTATTLPQ